MVKRWRYIGPTVSDLNPDAYNICAAGEAEKAPIIDLAIRKHYVNTLVVSSQLAREIMNLPKGRESSSVTMDMRTFGACVLRAAAEMPGHRDELCRLDMGIGDGDHGVTVERGFSAVGGLFSGDPGDGGQAFYQQMGDAMAASMGGAIGPIYELFAGLGAGLKDVDAPVLASAMELAVRKVMRVAKVQPGEKTIGALRNIRGRATARSLASFTRFEGIIR